MARSDGRTGGRSRRAQEPAAEANGRAMQGNLVPPPAAEPEPERTAPAARGRGTPTYGAEAAAGTGGAAATPRAFTTPEFWVGTRRYGPY